MSHISLDFCDWKIIAVNVMLHFDVNVTIWCTAIVVFTSIYNMHINMNYDLDFNEKSVGILYFKSTWSSSWKVNSMQKYFIELKSRKLCNLIRMVLFFCDLIYIIIFIFTIKLWFKLSVWLVHHSFSTFLLCRLGIIGSYHSHPYL